MSDPRQARALLEAAQRDLSALHGMADPAVFVDEIFGFHVQQAAEKLFKAWLALLDETYPLTHDLLELLERLTARKPDAARFDSLIEYTPYAVQFRYDGRETDAEPLHRGMVLEQVNTLFEEIRQGLEDAEGT